jgi:hypothetical protein
MLLYLKRLHANLFCDVAQNRYRVSQSEWHTDNLLSVGVDLLADINLLQIYFPMNVGIRTAYIPESKEIHPSLLLSVSF